MAHLLETINSIHHWHEDWVSVTDQAVFEGNSRTHGIAVDKNARVYIFHQAVPSMLIYDSDGCFHKSWGNYPGAHGLTLVEEEGREFLWLTDQETAAVVKTTTDGDVECDIAAPPYAANEPYTPTWVAVNEVRRGGNGDVWVADGYGSSRINRYDSMGNHLATLDGTEGAGRFDCPHGIWFDCRKTPMELYVADRGNHRVQVYDAHGAFLRSFGEDILTSPDGFAIDGDQLIIPELLGRITILDRDDQLLFRIGTNDQVCRDPSWPDKSALLHGKFNSPHAATTDIAGNLYVVEWRVGGRVLKLEQWKQARVDGRPHAGAREQKLV